MTEAMPFLQKAILLSYDPRPFPGGLLIVRGSCFPPPGLFFHRRFPPFPLRYRYPRATSSTIITTNPMAAPTAPAALRCPLWVSGISSTTTTYSMQPAAKAST